MAKDGETEVKERFKQGECPGKCGTYFSFKDQQVQHDAKGCENIRKIKAWTACYDTLAMLTRWERLTVLASLSTFFEKDGGE